MSEDILDIRTLATDWRSDLDGLTDAIDDAEHEIARDLRSQIDRYVSLCQELGVDEDPDSLERYGDGYEPTLIHEHYFTEYAQELAEDIAPFTSNSPEAELLSQWPYRCIDWEFAARELKYDYSAVTFDGETYYIRSC